MRYVHAYNDRHGKPRYYFRRGNLHSIALPGVPGTPDFESAYSRAMSGADIVIPKGVIVRKPVLGKGVYFVMDATECLVKIGFSKCISKRMRGLQTSNGRRLVLAAVIEGEDRSFEGLCHERFSHLHRRGEWFLWTDEIRKFLDDSPKAHWINRFDTSCTTPESISPLRQVALDFFASPAFKLLAKSTQKMRRRDIEKFCERYPSSAATSIRTKDVSDFISSRMSGTGDASRTALQAIRMLFQFALEQSVVSTNVALSIKMPKVRNIGIHCWTTDEMDAFKKRFPVGTMARLAFDFLIYTGQRISDVFDIRQSDIIGSQWCVRQKKTSALLKLPITKTLRQSINATPCGEDFFFVTTFGKPFSTARGFGNWFSDRCVEAGLPNCSAHGLRKSSATKAAEAGATEAQLMAFYGWKSSKEVRRYILAANQERLASNVGLLLEA